MTKLKVFKERNVDIYATVLCLFPGLNQSKNCKMFLVLPPVPSAVFGTNRICLLTLVSLLYFLTWKSIFPISEQCRFFLTFGIGSEDTFLIFWYKYVSVVAFIQYFMANFVVLVSQSRRKVDLKNLSK